MTNTLHLLRGTLTVAAKGYWYTGGGEKGSFGYYPHLKAGGFPIYPDTQVHGDLRMAALWAKGLGVDGSCIDELFGKSGHDTSALLHVGDLALSGDSLQEWVTGRFQVKPRIEIDDATRTVKGGMLANFEAAWLEGLVLEAPLYAGYFTDVAKMSQARELLAEASALLSGFGAFRSRGYGRGCARIEWNKPEAVTIEPADAPDGRRTYLLRSLVNVRNKPVAAEKLQLVGSGLCLTAEQVRGWFVRTYHQVSGAWPSAEEMATVTFSDLHPSPDGEPAWPPAMTTLRREDGSGVEDYRGRPPKVDQNSSYIRGDAVAGSGNQPKLKPLRSGAVVNDAGMVHGVPVDVRMRNAMEDGQAGGDFRTRKEGGLFAQQLVGAGTMFCGVISLRGGATDFGLLAGALLAGVKPTINGTLFESELTGSPEPPEPPGGTPLLVTMPVAFDPHRPFDGDESITLGTQRRYAPGLGRPRRGVPVIVPGSVLTTGSAMHTVPWACFGKALTQTGLSMPSAQSWPKVPSVDPLPGEGIHWGNLTRSQAGNLRELLNPDHNASILGGHLRHIRDKHVEKAPDSDLAKLYAALCEIHGRDGVERLRAKVKEIIDYLRIEVWWEKKAEGGATP